MIGGQPLSCRLPIQGAPIARIHLALGPGSRGPIRLLVNGESYIFDPAAIGDGEEFCRGDGIAMRKLGPSGSVLVSVDMHGATEIGQIALSGQSDFILHDILIGAEVTPGCPFKPGSGDISLTELGSIVRLGDPVRFQKAMNQLADGIASSQDLEEAKGLALTFLGVVTSSLLELGAPRSFHQFPLLASRDIDSLSTSSAVAARAVEMSRELVGQRMPDLDGGRDFTIDRSIGLIHRNFAHDIHDKDIAAEIGMSASHFRFLFKKTTGQPFAKYLLNLRLEKANRLLIESGASVSEISEQVGFASAAHFSRAFRDRFRVSPSQVRRATGRADET